MAHARVSPLSVSDASARVGRLGARLSRAVPSRVPPRPRARISRLVTPRAGPNPWDATKGAAKRASETVGEKAKSFWNDEVIGAKKAMERNAAAAPGKDVTRDLQVTLEEAVLGAKKSLSFERKRVCPTCQGTCRLPQTFIDCDQCAAAGLISTPTDVTVTVPPGVADGATLRLKDQGDDGDPPGQLYVKIRAASMNAGATIVRDGADLITRGVVVRFPKRGEPASVRVRTVEGEWGNLKVAADAKPGQGLKIRGRGAPAKPGGDERGDHVFVIERVVYEDEGAENEEKTEGAETDADKGAERGA